jgi:hypothetical protein
MTVTLPPFVREMKTAIETELDFTVLAHGGEARLFAWAKQNGLRGPALVTTWQRSYNQSHGGEGTRPAAPKKPMDDLGPDAPGLDDWPDDSDNDDDDSPPEQPPTILCPTCRGLGCDKTGQKCSECNGTGRIPAPGSESDDDDEWDDNEEQSRRWEWESEF